MSSSFKIKFLEVFRSCISHKVNKIQSFKYRNLIIMNVLCFHESLF